MSNTCRPSVRVHEKEGTFTISWLRSRELCVTKRMHVTPRDQTASTDLWSWDKWSRKTTYCNNRHLQQTKNKCMHTHTHTQKKGEVHPKTRQGRLLEARRGIWITKKAWEVQQPLLCFMLYSEAARAEPCLLCNNNRVKMLVKGL